MRRDLITSALAIVVFTVLFGLAYPLAMTGVSQVLFPNKADGSRIERDGEGVGSSLIGQDFKGSARTSSSRPSVTGYTPNVTYFNNLGPNQAELRDLFADNAAKLRSSARAVDRLDEVPVDAVTTSASGVDPHISEANARIQAHRVAEARGASARAGQRADRRQHRRALARLPRASPA